MTIHDLQGHYASAETTGPGTRYLLEVDPAPSGVKAPARFRLHASAWTLTGNLVPGTSNREVSHLGTRTLEGLCRLDGESVRFDAESITDRGTADRERPPLKRETRQSLEAEIVPIPLALNLLIHGARVLLLKQKS